MISLVQKKIFFKIVEEYFSDTCCINQGKYSGVDVVKLVQCNHEYCATCVKNFSTAVNDLSLSEEELFGNINKQLRYDIRRVSSNNTYSIFFINDNDAKGYDKAIKLLNHFLRRRNLPSLNITKMKKMWKTGVLKISVACSSCQDEDVFLGVHVYLVDKESSRGRLLYSYSNFEDHPNLNKFHHWEDILSLKGLSLEKYDFGGVSTDGSTDSIDRFKMRFGGRVEQSCNKVIGLTAKGRLALIIYRFFFR